MFELISEGDMQVEVLHYNIIHDSHCKILSATQKLVNQVTHYQEATVLFSDLKEICELSKVVVLSMQQKITVPNKSKSTAIISWR